MATKAKNCPSSQSKCEGNRFWMMNKVAERQAELLLYGVISQTSWYGDEVTPKEFAEELRKLGEIDKLTVRINSAGGDVFAAVAIGSQLAKLGRRVEVVGYIEGLCASAATLVACNCNRVVANPQAAYMIHLPKVGLEDYFDEKELNGFLQELRAIKETALNLYTQRTGRDKEEIEGYMDATSWWTPQQALEMGFVDEIEQQTNPPRFENRSGALFVNSVNTGIEMEQAPDFVKSALCSNAQRSFLDSEAAIGANNNKEEAMANTKDTGAQGAQASMTVEGLRTAYPALVEQIEKSAVNSERNRIKGIEDMALPGSESKAYAAKYGPEPVDAAGYAVAMMREMKKQGAEYLRNDASDAENSGTLAVLQATPPDKSDSPSMIAAVRTANGVK